MSDCNLYKEDFHASRETIGRMLLGPIIRKGYNNSQVVKNVLLTLFEAGLDRAHTSVFESHKITNPDESCKAKEDVSRNDGPRGACIHKIEDQRLSFDEIKQVVYLYVTGMAFSLLVFVLELLVVHEVPSSAQRQDIGVIDGKSEKATDQKRQ